jgi:hypothetical protein
MANAKSAAYGALLSSNPRFRIFVFFTHFVSIQYSSDQNFLEKTQIALPRVRFFALLTARWKTPPRDEIESFSLAGSLILEKGKPEMRSDQRSC